MGLYQSSILSSGLLQESGISTSAVTLTFSSATSGTFTVPQGVTSITVEGIGSGAAGNGGGAGTTGFQGGGGGGYAKTTIITSGGSQYYYYVGTGGSGNTTSADVISKVGKHTTFSSSTYTLLMRGSGGGTAWLDYGLGYSDYVSQGGGYQFGNPPDYPNIGDVTYVGGNGADQAITPIRTGGGGGAGGTLGAGGLGYISDGNRGPGSGGTGSDLYGGDGGDGYPVDTELGYQYGNGSPGFTFGGGGGGGASRTASVGYGGDGGVGLLIISYVIPNYI